RHLYLKSGSLSPFKRFAFELRDIVRRQPLPGYTLFIEVEISGRVLLSFEPSPQGRPVDGLVLSGTHTIVPSGTRGSCYREPKPGLSRCTASENRAPNLESNTESNSYGARGIVKGSPDDGNRDETQTLQPPIFPHSKSRVPTPELPLEPKPRGAK
ncbi:MAG: replication protein, partial [Mesorhizobium sp.]